MVEPAKGTEEPACIPMAPLPIINRARKTLSAHLGAASKWRRLLSSLGSGMLGRVIHDCTRSSGQTCNKNDNCASGRCIGNGGGLLSSFGAMDAGRCDYMNGVRPSSQSCNKNDNCASGRCIGNGGGLLSSFGAFDAGFCDYPNQSREPEQSCNKNDNW